MQYKRIRGPEQKKRCKNIGRYGSPLYCDCGCQEPSNDYPAIDLTNIIVTKRADYGYADYILTRNGNIVGEFNTQYCALFLGEYEYLGCDRSEMAPILSQIFNDNGDNRFGRQIDNASGDSLSETAASVRFAEKLSEMEQDDRYKNYPGYCTKCHSFCYGDCEAN